MLMVFGGEVKGQKYYATVTPSSAGITAPGVTLGGTAQVVDPTKAANNSNLDFAIMNSDRLVLTVLGQPIGAGNDTYLQLKFPSTIPLNATVFVKIDLPVISGLNIDVAGILGLIGNGIRIDAFANSTSTLDGAKLTVGPTSTIVKNSLGEYFIAITPKNSTDVYNSIRINFSIPTGLGLTISNGSMKVYNAFYEVAPICDATVPQDCGNALATDLGTQTGISLNLLSTILTNPTNAIDGLPNTSSLIQPGLVAVGTVAQTIYFPSKSSATDQAKLTVSIPASLLQVGLFDNISLEAYNGETLVGSSKTLKSLLLNLDLLTLFANDSKKTVFFSPGGIFDRIKISVTSLNVGGTILGGGLNIWEIQRAPSNPTFTLPSTQNVAICMGQSTSLTATTNSCNVLHWYTSSTGGTAVLGSSYPTGILNTTTIYYVSASRINCTTESERMPITVTVNPKPPHPNVNISSN